MTTTTTTATTMTKEYDLHVQFEIGYDEQPKIWAYELYLDKGGFLTTNGYAVASYCFTEEDTEQALAKFKESDSGIDTIDDLYWDEWFTTKDDYMMKTNLLSPAVLEWINSLPEYEMEVLD